MPFRRILVSAAAFALVLTAGAASAQTPMDPPDPLSARDAKRVDKMEKVVRELRSIVFQLRDTGKPVVVQTADTDARIGELNTRMSDLEQTLTRLNGALETVTHELDLTRRANADLQAQVKALNDKLTAQEAAPAETFGGAPPPPGPAAAADPASAFAQARQLMLGGDYDAAESAFRDFVALYPNNPKAPEARYWLGKTLTVRGAHADAAGAYIGAVRGWPRTGWAQDGVIELAKSLVALKKPAEACGALGEFARQYPKAPPATAARAQAVRTQAKCG